MVRVIIERRLKEGKEREVWELLYELRTAAIRQPGYLFGETLVGHDDHSLFIVISTWLGADLWQAWTESTERQALVAKVELLLSTPARTTILKFMDPTRLWGL